jgi:hypothetical protein
VLEVGFSSFHNIIPSSACRGRRKLGHAFGARHTPKEPSWKTGGALGLQLLDCVIREMQSYVLSLPHSPRPHVTDILPYRHVLKIKAPLPREPQRQPTHSDEWSNWQPLSPSIQINGLLKRSVMEIHPPLSRIEDALRAGTDSSPLELGANRLSEVGPVRVRTSVFQYQKLVSLLSSFQICLLLQLLFV